MTFILRSLLCGCLLATVAHCVELEINPELKKRLHSWLGSKLRRDLHSLSLEQMAESEQLVRPEDIRDSITHSSAHTSIRTKRSNQPRRQGCSLGTCTVHDLAHRLHQLNNKLKIGSAPVDKISPQGYGRRRRSLPDHVVGFRLDRGRMVPVWGQSNSQVYKLEALLRRT